MQILAYCGHGSKFMKIACAASLLEYWHDYINISMEMILTYSSLGFISYIWFESHFL